MARLLRVSTVALSIAISSVVAAGVATLASALGYQSVDICIAST